MSAAFSDWLDENGHVPEGVTVPAGAGVGAVMSAVGRQIGPRTEALSLWRVLPDLYDRYTVETGTPRVGVVRASPIGEATGRALAGVLGAVL